MKAEVDQRRTSFAELFFDLVFVFAVAEVAVYIRNDGSVMGFVRAGVLFGLVWWCWCLFTWMGNMIDLTQSGNRAAILLATVLVFSMGLMLPGALDETGAGFALLYCGVRLVGSWFYWAGMRSDAGGRAALASFIPLSLVSPALVVLGGFLGPGIRIWVWTVALSVDVASALNAGKAEFRVSPSHFAERHGLFVIIALGEVIVATGLAVAGDGLSIDTMAGAVVVAIGAVVLWWAYFDWFQQAAEHTLASSGTTSRGRVARDLFTLIHYPIVAGIIGFAVGAEEIALHPGDHLESLAAVGMAGGVGLILLGFVIGNRRAQGQVLWERLVAAAVVVVLVVLGGGLPGLTVGALVILVVAVALAFERFHRRNVVT